jgi:biopolymer transport protein ExbD
MRLLVLLLLVAPAWADSTAPAPARPGDAAKGKLTITVGPAGAIITVDGKNVDSKSLPLTLAPGIYKIELAQYPKYAHYAVRVRAGETTTVVHDFAKQKRQDPDALTIGVRKNGSFVLDDAPIDRELLVARLEMTAKAYPDAAVFIAADKDTPYGLVVALMDLVRKTGLQKLSLATEPARAIAADFDLQSLAGLYGFDWLGTIGRCQQVDDKLLQTFKSGGYTCRKPEEGSASGRPVRFACKSKDKKREYLLLSTADDCKEEIETQKANAE